MQFILYLRLFKIYGGKTKIVANYSMPSCISFHDKIEQCFSNWVFRKSGVPRRRVMGSLKWECRFSSTRKWYLSSQTKGVWYFVLRHYSTSLHYQWCRSQWSQDLKKSVCGRSLFEISYPAGSLYVCMLWAFFVPGRGLFVGPITRSKKSYGLWCVWVRKAATLRMPWPTRYSPAQKRNSQCMKTILRCPNHTRSAWMK
jgi:hypothetical protein